MHDRPRGEVSESSSDASSSLLQSVWNHLTTNPIRTLADPATSTGEKVLAGATMVGELAAMSAVGWAGGYGLYRLLRTESAVAEGIFGANNSLIGDVRFGKNVLGSGNVLDEASIGDNSVLTNTYLSKATVGNGARLKTMGIGSSGYSPEDAIGKFIGQEEGRTILGNDVHIVATRIGGNVHIGDNARINLKAPKEGVDISHGVEIGPNVEIADGVKIERYAKIGEGSRLAERTIVLADTEVPAGTITAPGQWLSPDNKVVSLFGERPSVKPLQP